MAQTPHKSKSNSQLMKQQEQRAKKTNKVSRGIRKNPKTAGLAKEKAMERKLTAKNIQNLEAQMALKAGSTGKLTIMKPIADKAKEDQPAKKKK